VPGYSNPQSLNRYSYVLNNPIKLTDPSGHKCVGEAEECMNEKGKPINGAGRLPSKKNKDKDPGDSNQQTLDWLETQQFANWFTGGWDLTVLDLWEGAQNIDSVEWQLLLAKLGANVHDTSKIELLLKAVNYDTPLFDKGRFFGLSRLKGVGCIEGACYDRSELNYIGEGELWAAIGVPKPLGHLLVWDWKQTKSFPPFDLGNPVPVTNKTFEMFDVGYDSYEQNYGSIP
jgi:hypothetical protein